MNPKEGKFKVMFLCTGNSARSIMAEYIMRSVARAKFDVVSAGSFPKPAPHPAALRVLEEDLKILPEGARSKSWEEFRDVEFDFVITLCDNAKESCPVWPGQPITAHWGSPDPAATEGSEEEVRKEFWRIAMQLRRRIELFASLPFEKLDGLRLAEATRGIGDKEKIAETENA